MVQQYTDNMSVMAPARGPINVPVDANPLDKVTRFVMVTDDDATITGYFNGDATEHTTAPLKAGVMYYFSFERITAVSSGTVKAYY